MRRPLFEGIQLYKYYYNIFYDYLYEYTGQYFIL